MKTKTILQILGFLPIVSTATTEQGIYYKAIIHDDNGNPMDVWKFLYRIGFTNLGWLQSIVIIIKSN